MPSPEPNDAPHALDMPTDSNKAISLSQRYANMVTGWANAAPLRFALVVVCVLQLLVLMAFRPSYGTNDDVFMTMIASGKGIGDAPDAHLVFTNILIGAALKQLYIQLPDVPWYGAYLLLTHLVAQVALLYCALLIGRPATSGPRRRWISGHFAPAAPWELGLRLGMYLLYYTLVELPLLNQLQFTSTAFLAATAGLFLVLTAWRRRSLQSDAPVGALLCAATLLLLVSGLIRIESLALAGLIALPVAIIVSSKFTLHALVPCSIAVVAAAALVAGATVYDYSCYEQDPQWTGFRSLNQLRGKFHDERWTSYTPETAPLFAQVGWTENDHAMIARWFSDNAMVYTPSRMTAIVEGFPWQLERQTIERWTTTIRDISRNRAVLSVLLVLPFVLIALPGGSYAKWSVAGTLIAAAALIALITWTKKSPPIRVYFPLMSFPLAVSLLALGWRREAVNTSARHAWRLISSLWSWKVWRQQTLPNHLTVCLLVVAVVMGVYSQIRRSSHVAQDRVHLAQFLETIQPTDQTLYVSWEAALPYELVSPLDNLSAWPTASFLSLAWTQQTAWHEAVKRRFGISDLAHALYSRDDIQLIARPAHRKLFAKFAEEHFDVDVEFVPHLEAGHKFTVGKFRLREPRMEIATPAAASPHR
jgi:hypothetical protein